MLSKGGGWARRRVCDGSGVGGRSDVLVHLLVSVGIWRNRSDTKTPHLLTPNTELYPPTHSPPHSYTNKEPVTSHQHSSSSCGQYKFVAHRDLFFSSVQVQKWPKEPAKEEEVVMK